MVEFQVKDISLQIPERCLVPNLINALNAGDYESTESTALIRHLRDEDRFLDLGAGAGFLCSLAAQTVGAERVMGVEANPDMVPAAQDNVNRNAGPGGRILHGAVVADAFQDETVTFLVRQGFWAGLAAPDLSTDHPQAVTVPALKISEILSDHRPTLVSMDIEGGEADLADYLWPGHVRLVVMEIHTKRYKPRQLQNIFTGFFDQGFDFCPHGTHGETVIFKRSAPQH